MDGAAKNLDRVRQEFADWKLAQVITTHQVKGAWRAGKYLRAIHHATGYLKNTIEELSKFWFYTWLPKWLTVILIMVILSGCDPFANSR